MEITNIINIEQFNDLFFKINPEYLEYKGKYFFRNKNDTNRYELSNNKLGDFLCINSNLFKFDNFVMSSSPFRLYKISENYCDMYFKYIDILKYITMIIYKIEIKSIKHLIDILKSNGFDCYIDKESYPFLYYQSYTKPFQTLYIEYNKIHVKFPYYYAYNIKNKRFYNMINKIIESIN